MVISIDVGYGVTKVFAGEQNNNAIITRFQSVYMQTYDTFIPNMRGDYIHIELDGQKYYMGKYALAKEGTSAFNKYDMLRHKLCILTGIARTLKKNFTGIVALGLPIEDMALLKDKLESFIGQYDFIYNGISYNINIQKIEVYPQGVTAFDELAAYDKTEVENAVIGIVDIGQKTVDVAWYIDGIMVPNRTRSYDNMGCNFVYQDIVRKIYELKGYQIADYQVGDRIKNRPELAEIAEPFFKDFASKIETELLRLGWNYNELDKLYLIGGGAYYVNNYLKNSIPCVEMHPQPEFANACGYYFKAVNEHGK